MNALTGICRKSGVGAAALVTILVATPTHATGTPGEKFVYDWTETSGPAVGLTGTVDFTLGPAATMPGFFTLASFDVTQSGGFCGICKPLTEDLTGALFDSTTLGIEGTITGSFVNGKGRTHMFDLVTVDLPAGTWTFTDTGPGGGSTTSMGTYTTKTSTSVPEPASLALFGIGLLGLGLSRRRP